MVRLNKSTMTLQERFVLSKNYKKYYEEEFNETFQRERMVILLEDMEPVDVEAAAENPPTKDFLIGYLSTFN